MKKVCITLCAVFLMVVFANRAKADAIATYYVVNGEEFILKPSGTDVFSKLIWHVGNKLEEINGAIDQGQLKVTFDDAIDEVKMKKITLSVMASAEGCISNVLEYNVIVLPKIAVAVDVPTKIDFCKEAAISFPLTAKVTATTAGLDTYGVTISPLKWKKDGTILSQGIDANGVLTVTGPGTYEAYVEYILPAVGHVYEATASKLLKAVTTTEQVIQQTIDLPSVPALQLL